MDPKSLEEEVFEPESIESTVKTLINFARMWATQNINKKMLLRLFFLIPNRNLLEYFLIGFAIEETFIRNAEDYHCIVK